MDEIERRVMFFLCDDSFRRTAFKYLFMSFIAGIKIFNIQTGMVLKVTQNRIASDVDGPVTRANIFVEEKLSGAVKVKRSSMSAIVEFSTIVWIAM